MGTLICRNMRRNIGKKYEEKYEGKYEEKYEQKYRMKDINRRKILYTGDTRIVASISFLLLASKKG